MNVGANKEKVYSYVILVHFEYILSKMVSENAIDIYAENVTIHVLSLRLAER